MALDFLDMIRGGSAYNQGEAVAGDLPTDGARASDVRGIFSRLSETATDVVGLVNSFTPSRKKNEQKPAVPLTTPSVQRWVPIAVLVAVGVAIWWFLRKK